MANINPEKLAEPIYGRLPVERAEEILNHALEQGRTLGLQLRRIRQNKDKGTKTKGSPIKSHE